MSSRDDVFIEAPLAGERIPPIQAGEPIVFLRDFEGVRQKSSYFELNQKIAHIMGLHHLEDRDAWCMLDKRGDIDEIVKSYRIAERSAHGGRIVAMRRDHLARYAAAGDYVVLRMFDFTRFRSGDISRWDKERASQPLGPSKTVFGKLTVGGASGSYSRGVQILDLGVHKSALIRGLMHGDDDETEKEYATFVALDWRHDTVGEFSCDPNLLANYFVPSPHPFETSPAFFCPEVLSKYKADTEKYTIEARSISCRGAWYLKGYGVNPAGQVHAYLGDLSHLPYEEQLHWKQFNEAPKAGLSPSVVATDFHGEWSTEYDPLVALKQKLDDVERRQVGWWTVRDEAIPRRVRYPLSESRDDWASEIMNLDQLLVEGLVEKWLRKKAAELGRSPDDRLRSLKLLEECLCGLGFEESHAREILAPWHTVHNLRSELKGHASNSEGRKHESMARREYGNLMNHFRQLCQGCDESLGVIASALEGAEMP